MPGLHDATVRVGGVSLPLFGREWLYHLRLSPPLLFAVASSSPPLLHTLWTASAPASASRCRRSSLQALEPLRPSPFRYRHPLAASIALAAPHFFFNGLVNWLPPSSHQEPLPPASPDPLHGITSVPLQSSSNASSRSALKRQMVRKSGCRLAATTRNPTSSSRARAMRLEPYTQAIAVQQDRHHHEHRIVRPLHPIHHFDRLHRTPSDPSGLPL